MRFYRICQRYGVATRALNASIFFTWFRISWFLCWFSLCLPRRYFCILFLWLWLRLFAYNDEWPRFAMRSLGFMNWNVSNWIAQAGTKNVTWNMSRLEIGVFSGGWLCVWFRNAHHNNMITKLELTLLRLYRYVHMITIANLLNTK